MIKINKFLFCFKVESGGELGVGEFEINMNVANVSCSHGAELEMGKVWLC
jgi:hypothetical protein